VVLRGGIGDAALRHLADRVVRRDRRRPVRPPGHHRGIGEQEGEHHRVGVLAELAVQPEDDDLTRAGVPADADLGVDPRTPARRAAEDDEDAAGVFVAGLVRGGDRLLVLVLPGVDDEGQHAAERDRATAVP
jgi:hypothetical protein